MKSAAESTYDAGTVRPLYACAVCQRTMTVSDDEVCRSCRREAAFRPLCLESLARANLKVGERGPADLIRKRAETWSLRSDKWHKILETERAWLWRGLALPALIGAAVGMVGLWLPAYQSWWSAVGVLLTGLVGWRAHAARSALDIGQASKAWAAADRLAEHYRGLIVKLERGETEVNAALDESQKLEAVARFGVPDALQDALRRVS